MEKTRNIGIHFDATVHCVKKKTEGRHVVEAIHAIARKRTVNIKNISIPEY